MRSGYTLPMRRRIALVAFMFLLAAGQSAAVDPPLADGVSGAPIVWSDVIGKRGPVAVLMWASWAPGAPAVIDDWDEIALASRGSGLYPLIVDVQATLADIESLPDLVAELVRDGVRLTRVEPITPTLEELYFEMQRTHPEEPS